MDPCSNTGWRCGGYRQKKGRTAPSPQAVGADGRLARPPELAHQIPHLLGSQLEVHLDRRMARDAGRDAASRVAHGGAPAILLALGQRRAHEPHRIEPAQARRNGAQDELSLAERLDVVAEGSEIRKLLFERDALGRGELERKGRQEELLAHLRRGGEHVRGCWAVDAVLGRT